MGLLLTGVGRRRPAAPKPLPFLIADEAKSTSALTISALTSALAPAGSRLFAYLDTHSGLAPAGIATDGLTWSPLGATINQGGHKQMFFADLAEDLPAGSLITGTGATSSRLNLVVFCAPGWAGSSLDVRHGSGAAGTFTPPDTGQPSIVSPALDASKAKLVVGVLELAGAASSGEITEAAGWTTIGDAVSAAWLLRLAYQLVPAGDGAPRTYDPALSASRNWVADILSVAAG